MKSVLVALAIVCCSVAHAYDGVVTLVLSEYMGNPVPLETESRAWIGAQPQREDRETFRPGEWLEGLGEMDPSEAYRRILISVSDHFAQNPRTGVGVDAFFLGGKTPALRLRESLVGDVRALFEGTELDLVWTIHQSSSAESEHVGADLEPVLLRREEVLHRLLRRVMRVILPGEDGEVTPNLRRVDFEGLLGRFERDRNLGGWEGAPSRVMRPRGVNLAEMTAAEANWSKELSSMFHTLEKLVRNLSGLSTEQVDKEIGELEAYRGALSALGTGSGGTGGEELESGSPRPSQSVASAVAYVLAQFQNRVRHSQRQWKHLNPSDLMPLYSYGLLVAMDLAESYLALMGGYTHPELERATIGILDRYVEEEFDPDPNSVQVLARMAKQRDLHPLLRLSAYAVLERQLGKVAAEYYTEIPEPVFRELYALAFERVTLSPTELTACPLAHIDYFCDLKYSVVRHVNMVAHIASERGLPPPDLPARAEVNDLSKPKLTDPAEAEICDILLSRGVG